MARVDVLELKSFQKISLNEVSYLGELDFKKNQLRCADAHNQIGSAKVLSADNTIKAKLQALTRLIKLALHNILYETVPQCDTYSAE